MHYHWSSPLHYVSPLGDHPPDACAWGGEVKNEHNVLSAVLNYTHRVDTLRQDEDLRFLVQCVPCSSHVCDVTDQRDARAAMWATCISHCISWVSDQNT